MSPNIERFQHFLGGMKSLVRIFLCTFLRDSNQSSILYHACDVLDDNSQRVNIRATIKRCVRKQLLRGEIFFCSGRNFQRVIIIPIREAEVD